MPRKIGIYQFGPFRLEAGEHRLLRDGIEVTLQLKAFETLCVLVESPGRLLTKDDLLSQLWPDTMVEENNLNKVISLLRKALGEGVGGQCYIETVPRVGYRFAASVAQMLPHANGNGASAQTAQAQTAAEKPAERTAEKSVAVLYFENLSGNCEDEYFRDGMTEDVITELEKVRGLRLFPRSCVLAYRDSPLPVTEVGRKLGAAYVLEGSFRRSGDRLRLTA